jgi:hypothetical protein
MVEENTFKKVGKTAKALYGPSAMLVCGYSRAEQKDLRAFLEAVRISDLSIVFITEEDGEVALKELMARPDQSGGGPRDAGSTVRSSWPA